MAKEDENMFSSMSIEQPEEEQTADNSPEEMEEPENYTDEPDTNFPPEEKTQNENEPFDPDLQLEYEKENLQEQVLNDEEEELPPPPEKNEGKQLNVGNILAITLIGIALIVILVMFLSAKKEKKTDPELEKAGYKNSYEFQNPNSQYNGPQYIVVEDGFSIDENGNISTDLSELKEIANSGPTMPDPYAMPEVRNRSNTSSNRGTAPAGVNSVGSSSSSSEKPDTRNSRSPRKIDGIKGQSNNSHDNNYSKVEMALNGNYPYQNNSAGYNGYQQPKQDYINENLSRINNGQNNTNNDVSRGNFFEKDSGNAGAGQYLSDNCLWDGTIISGILITAINTDNPGVVIARVSENVYSSYDHKYLLIPEGSTLFGEYNYEVSYGQGSIQVGWNLIIRPDGYRVQIGNFPGVNGQGASGYKGQVSEHPFQTLKAMGLIALFSVVQTEVVNDMNTQSNEYLKNAMTDIYAQATDIENRILNRALDIKPTLKVKEGTEIKLITNVPLTLPPCKVPKPTKKYIRN